MPAHASALRRGRASETGRAYLVTTVTLGRRPLFADFLLARHAVRELHREPEKHRARTLAFVLMPDHLHWLLQLERGDLAQVVGHFKASAARAVNQCRGAGGGPVWQPGFHDHALRKDEDLLASARYLIANPIRAGLVHRVGDYPHWDAIWLEEPMIGTVALE